MHLPPIIQGGMGAGVSSWRLARAVACRGQFGVVSGTALDVVMVRRLQLGDEGGHVRRALAAFPDAAIADRIVAAYFIEGGKDPDQPFRAKPLVGNVQSRRLQELIVAANFVEVFLAREGHDGMVGINYLEKIQTPTLPSLYGAMLAGVDAVIMGAGIPKDIPGVLDRLAHNEPVSLKLHVADAAPEASHTCDFDPRTFLDAPPAALRRPLFFPIVSSVTLATMLVKRSNGRVDGLVIERPTAGGHNAPPRGRSQFNDAGEPIYGPRDEVDLAAIHALGLPFWVAGSCGDPAQLAEARAAGAVGIQVGTLFAFCEESGLDPQLKRRALALCAAGQQHVRTDPVASPTGFPFKVFTMAETHSQREVYESRCRVCDLGYLREPYERPGQSLGWRCPAEPEADYLSKGGAVEDTAGRKCLCNGLMANIGLGQVQKNGDHELPLLTCGDDTARLLQVLRPGANSYSAADVLDFLTPGITGITPGIALGSASAKEG